MPNHKLIIRGSLSLFLCVAGISATAQSSDVYVCVPKGAYKVGKKGSLGNPYRTVRVDSFYIATKETTNLQFEQFVLATGYVTDAEKRKDAQVFSPGLDEFEWITDSTAYWRFPNGITRGGIADKMDHPVTCISFHDISNYCAWAGVRLPSLDEWEIASRSGASTDYFFGDSDSSIIQYANVWHGNDHLQTDTTDGFMYTSPVGRFAPNAWGLYDMYGNVFEFCTGKQKPMQSNTVAHARGGSWWCSRRSCHFFNSVDIGRTNKRASFSNQGFRVVR